MTNVAVLLTVLALGIAVLFVLLIFPIWALVHCAVSPGLNGTSKAVWIVVMLLVWPIGAFLYGLFASQQRALRWCGGVSLALVTGLLAAVVVGMPYILQYTDREMSATIQRLDQLRMPEASQEQRAQLKQGLQTLQNELQGNWILQRDRVGRVMTLYQLFSVYIEDHELSLPEYTDWMDKYRSRQLLDQEELRRYIRGLKYKR